MGHAGVVCGLMEKCACTLAPYVSPCACLRACVFQLDKCPRITPAPAFINTDGSWQPANADKDTGRITSSRTSWPAYMYICCRLHLHHLFLNPHAVHQWHAGVSNVGKQCSVGAGCWCIFCIRLYPPLQKYSCDAGLISWGVDFRARKSGGQEVTLAVIAVSLWTEGAERATGSQFPNLFRTWTLMTSTYSNAH